MDMPRKLPLYVTRERRGRNKRYFYFRKGKGPRTRLPDIDSFEFEEAYIAALAGAPRVKKRVSSTGTLQWLIDRYRETGVYRGLSTATIRQRDNIFRGVVAKSGQVKYRAVTKAKIVQGRDDRSATPAQARNFLDAMRGLFRWALEAELVDVDPTAGVTNPKRQKGPGFEMWSDAEVEQYRAHWLLGTHERVWLEVVIGTGARRGDAVLIGRQHIKNGMISIETQKEGVWAYVPILPTMQEAIATGPTGDLAFIVGKRGQPLVKESFGNMFGAACRAAGIRKSAHGLRKYTATAYANEGLSDAELESIFGWVRGSAMAAHYSRNAQRMRLSQGAAERLRNAQAPNVADTFGERAEND